MNRARAQVHIPVHTRFHPPRRGEGALRHRGLHGRRRHGLLLLHALRQLPDGLRDQGQGRRQLTRWNLRLDRPKMLLKFRRPYFTEMCKYLNGSQRMDQCE